MKLSEIFGQEYVLVETEYGVRNVDTTSDENDYEINKSKVVALKDLESAEDTSFIAETIKELGADGEENGRIYIYEGTVTTVSGTENCTIYAPEFWQ